MPSIVGTWTLVCANARDATGKALPPPFGPKAMGRVIFTADRRMMSVVCDGRAAMPEGMMREYSSYCGNYTFDGVRLVIRVDAASEPSRIGSDQLRDVRFTGERIILVPPPRGTGAATEFREITWERINPGREDHGGVHDAFAVAHEEYEAALDHLRAHGVEITFEEDRQGGGARRAARLFSRSPMGPYSSSSI